MPELLLSRVNKSLEAFNLDKSLPYGVAYSGGPDSTFLLICLKKSGFSDITALYINYHDSSRVDIEEATVKKIVNECGYKLRQYNTKIPKGPGINFESVARDVRYNVFSLVTSALHLKGVFVAHQKDDLVETFLMQRMRGGYVSFWGLESLTKYKAANIIRPLLDVRKSEIEGYLKFNNIEYFEDYTNHNQLKTRNWIRDNILPHLDWDNTIKEIEDANIALKEKQKIIKGLDKVSTSYQDYLLLPEELKLRLLYTLVTEGANKKAAPRKLVAARNLAYENLKNPNSTEETKLYEGISLYRNYDSFYIRPTITRVAYEHELIVPDKYEFDEFAIDLSNLASFNLKKEDFPICIRSIKKDDQFATGIVNSSVYSFLKSNKVPMYLREFYPVIVNKDKKIICVPFIEDIHSGKLKLVFKDYLL
jgi:tRNA(Ile)-lysidine synthase